MSATSTRSDAASPEASVTSTPESSPTRRATAAAGEPITLSEAVWIGRGEIVDAEFLGPQYLLAVAWSNGVSLFDLQTKSEKWYRETPTNVVAFDAQSGGVYAAAVLADGKVLVYKTSDGSAEVFEKNPQDAYWADIAWSPDGRYLAYQFTNVASTPIYLLEPATGEVKSLPGSWLKDSIVPNLVWSPDGETITVASAPENGCPKVISITDGKALFSLDSGGLCAAPLTLAYLSVQSNQKVFLAAAGGDHAVELISYPDGSPAGSFDDPSYQPSWEDRGLFSDAAGKSLVSLGGRYEFSYGFNVPLIVWDVSTGKPAFEFSDESMALKGMRRIAGGFAGDQIFVLYEDGQIMVWDYSSTTGGYSGYARLAVDAVQGWRYGFSANGERIATEGQYGGVVVWETASGSLIRRFDASLAHPALNFDGSRVSLYDHSTSRQTVVDVASGEPVWSFLADVPTSGATFSPDGSQLAFNLGNRVLIAGLADGKVQALIAENESAIADKELTWMKWSPDGKAVAAAFMKSDQGSIVLWESGPDGNFVDRFQVQHALGFDTQPSYAPIVFSPSGNKVAFAENYYPDSSRLDQTLVIYDRESDTVTREIPNFRPMAWVDENTLLALEIQINIRFAQIDAASGAMIFGSGGDYLYASSRPGGKAFARLDSPGRDISIVDWRTGKILAHDSHQSLGLTGVSWSPDGRWVASLASDGTLKLWEVIGG